MRLSRSLQLRVRWLLDELLPPRLRDARWFMAMPMRLVFRDQAELVMGFKERAYSMTQEEFTRAYRLTGECALTKGTDLNEACMDRILADVIGPKVLEVGCGEGKLSGAMSRSHQVTACDIVIRPELSHIHPHIRFQEANAEELPFGDDEFDTVVCTHTLEHVRNLRTALSELRRVARRRLIVVVPMERPYRYTFNLHLHFFPYPHALRAAMGDAHESVCDVVDGDLYYVEDSTQLPVILS